MKFNKKFVLIVGALIVAAFVLAACGTGPEGAAGPAGPAGPQGEAGPAPAAADLACTECHNDTTLIVSKDAQFNTSVHGTGTAYLRGASKDCAGCHGSEASKTRINAGLPPHDASVEGVVNVSPFNCRTCHNIHTTYTKDDFSLTGGEQPVKFEYSDGTFDGGAGNLCASCHQIRNPKPEVKDGNIAITSNRYGTHYGTESQMLAGEGGLGLTGTPSMHYTKVKDTCVGCHMGEEFNHTYLPKVDRCQDCHADVTNFDVNGVQTEVEAMLEELHTLFVEKNLMNPDAAANPSSLWGIYDPAADKWSNPSANAPLTVPEAVANAMWNYKLVTYDQSMGVHNPAYAKALLEAALETMKAYTP
ncbi:MAG: cytochrome c3 family protein [Anaerolineales bacterium]|nr:cytochrome c3 family protein [Anaerolineales bacterium]